MKLAKATWKSPWTTIPAETIECTERVIIEFANCVRLDSSGPARDGEYRLAQKECWIYACKPCELSDWKVEFMVVCDSPPMRTSFCATREEAKAEMEYALMKFSEGRAPNNPEAGA